jgi:SAM-dependent methyltransferase
MDPDRQVTDRGYDSVYEEFDSPLMRQIRREAYGEDIGQHSWVGADEVRADIRRLALTSASTLIDLGCGPCGPLTYIVAAVGCHGTGVDVSPAAIRAGRHRATELEVGALVSVHEADLNATLPFPTGTFSSAMSLDVVLHMHNRAELFAEVARVLQPRGRFLLTDAGVVTGAVSSEEIRRRSAYGPTQIVDADWNERLLATAGFRLLEVEDRTRSALRNASGRFAANEAHREELEDVLGVAAVNRQQEYLHTVMELSRRGAVSRFMYLAETRGEP